jgi:glycosyltransferase involved in cell wall biosynthesis
LDDYFPLLDDYPGLRDPGGSARMIKRLTLGLARFRPDVVNVHFVRPGCLTLLRLRKVFGYRVILTFHGSDALRPETESARCLPRLLQQADAVTAVSPRVAERLAGICPSKADQIEVIANGIDYPFWSAGRCDTDASNRKQPDPPHILAVGRLNPVKAHRVLVEALGLLHRHHPDARLTVLGEGECRRDLEQQIDRLGLSDKVSLPGEASAEQVRDQLREASVFALPSLSEGMPLSLLEAMAAGVPCVASAVGGVPRLTEHGEAELVPPDNAPALAQALDNVLSQPQLQAQLRSGGDALAQRCTGQQTLIDYEQEFKRLMTRSRSRLGWPVPVRTSKRLSPKIPLDAGPGQT